MLRSIVFDVGETLLDDTAEWGRWADWVGVPHHTFSAVMGAVVMTGRDNGETFQYFRPGFDVHVERRLREEAGCGERITESDLYPDVRSTLGQLRAAGYWVGVSGNQSARAGELLRALDLPVDAVLVSGDLGLVKPSVAYFDWLALWAPGSRDQIRYVGDNKHVDVIPARAQGFRSALVKRGPWGHLWGDDGDVRRLADWVVGSLAELPQLLGPAG